MTKKPSTPAGIGLERKLTAYALAGGALLAATETAHASIIYSGLVNQTVASPSDSFGIDLNGDSTIDFTIQGFSSMSVGEQGINIVPGPNNGVAKSGFFKAAALNAGTQIPGSLKT